MEYLKVEFTAGLTGQGYQEVSGGEVVRLTDLDGNTVAEGVPCEYHVIDSAPAFLTWGSYA